MESSRRSLLTGLVSFAVFSPAICRASSLDLVKGVLLDPRVLAYYSLSHKKFIQSGVIKADWKKILELAKIPSWPYNAYAMKHQSEIQYLTTPCLKLDQKNELFYIDQ